MNATLLRNTIYPYENLSGEAQPRSWPRYLHGASVLPALLPNLHLKLSCEKGFMIAEQDLFSLQILTRLQTLHLNMASDGSGNMSTMKFLQHLTALRQLGVKVKGLGPTPMFLAPELGKLTLLTSVSMQQALSRQPERAYITDHAGDVIGHLTGLQELTMRCLVVQIGQPHSPSCNIW